MIKFKKKETVNKKLEEALCADIDYLGELEVGSKERTDILKEIKDLSDANASVEKEKNSKKNIFLTAGVAAMTAILTLGRQIWATNKSLEVEFGKQEVVTSTSGKQALRDSMSSK